nr:hypothetical protein [Tanacetum cinerariifolium]
MWWFWWWPSGVRDDGREVVGVIGVVEWLQWWGDGCGGEAAMDEREVVTAVVGDGWRLVWDDGGVGEDVVVRWWHEGVGSSGGCGVACRLGWLEFWPDGEGGAEKLFEEGGGVCVGSGFNKK